MTKSLDFSSIHHINWSYLDPLISAEPSISLQAVETTASSHNTLLVCSAYDFYPTNIRITWYQNGQEVTSGVTLSEVMTNGDWTYQVHSYLEYSSGRHDAVTCMVEHASLKEPKIYEWGENILFMMP